MMIDKVRTLEQARLVSEVVAESLQKAAEQARKFFGEVLPFDGVVFADLVRFYARIYFRQHSLETGTDDSKYIATQTVANIGLELSHGGLLFKVLKADDGLLPVPSTNSRVEFYEQQLGMVTDPRTKELRFISANLIYLWSYSANLSLSSIRLVCPEHGGYSRDRVIEHWSELIFLPTVMAARDAASTDLEYELGPDRKDLDFASPDEDVARKADGESKAN